MPREIVSVRFAFYDDYETTASYPSIEVPSVEMGRKLARLLAASEGRKLSRVILESDLPNDLDLSREGCIGLPFDVRLTRTEILEF